MKNKYVTHSREAFFDIAIDLIRKDDRILDIGPGNGKFADQCNRMDVYFLEANLSSVENLKTRFKNVFLSKLPNLPFEKGFFDIIHMSHVVEHLQPQELYETLQEIDRCCAPGGAVVISTPVLWEGFYDDLSHVKPYNPAVFLKYLCNGENYSLSREVISDQFRLERLEYRLKEKKLFQGLKKSKSFFPKMFYDGYDFIRKNFVRQHQITGYTLVLRKAKYNG